MKRWVLRSAMLAVFVILAMAAAEGVLRIREARRVYREAARRFHPFLQHVPSASTLDGINAERFRGDEIAVEKPATTLRVFALGGSTTLGVSNGVADTYPRLLQERLQQQFPNVRVEVQNAGVDWYTTAHSLINYQLRIRRFHPDIVLVIHAINDLYRSFAPPWLTTGPFKSDYSHYLGPQIAFVGPPVGFQEGYERGGSMIGRALEHALARDPSPLDLSPAGVARLRARLRPVDVTTFRSLDSFKANYDLLIRGIRADGAMVIAGSESFLYKDGLSPDEERRLWFAPVFCAENGTYPTVASMRDGIRQFNDAARAIAQRHDVGFLEFEAMVPKTLEYFQDDAHLTRAGNDILARMTALLIINNPVPRLPAPSAAPTSGQVHHRP
jgi:lysophospholipase L1-like esterase